MMHDGAFFHLSELHLRWHQFHCMSLDVQHGEQNNHLFPLINYLAHPRLQNLLPTGSESGLLAVESWKWGLFLSLQQPSQIDGRGCVVRSWLYPGLLRLPHWFTAQIERNGLNCWVLGPGVGRRVRFERQCSGVERDCLCHRYGWQAWLDDESACGAVPYHEIDIRARTCRIALADE